MGYDPKATETGKRKYAMDGFQHAVDYRCDEHQEAHRAGRFLHNSATKGQWEPGDLESLHSKGRAAFSFNVVKATVDKMLGMHRDGLRKATAMPVGGEDQFVADIVNALADRVYKDSELSKYLLGLMQSGYYHGEGNIMLDVRPDPDDPGRIALEASSLSRYEVHWDPASRALDRSDARHVFVSRWLSRHEFTQLYPDKSAEFDKLKAAGDRNGGDSLDEFYADHSEMGAFSNDSGGMYGTRSTHQYRNYFETRRNRIRVIHAEFKVAEKRHFMRNTQTGQTERIKGGEKVAKAARDMIATGALPNAEIVTSWGEAVHVLDFIGNTTLTDEKSPQPFDGFSVEGWAHSIDSETGEAYGPMRNLFDPQMEINKAHSLALEQTMGQAKPGYIAEKGAIPDVDQFEDSYATNAALTIVNDTAIQNGRIQPRPVAQASPAAQQRLQNSIEMVQRISGVGTEMESPSAHAEAATTQMLRYHQARLSMATVVESHEVVLRRVLRKVVQMLVRAVPEPQLAKMLGNDDRYGIEMNPQTGEPMVVEYETDEETGQRGIKNAAPMGSLRDLQYDIELEVTSENGVARIAESRQLFDLEAARPGTVDPALLVSKVVESRHEKERLQKYAEDSSKAQQKATEQEQQVSLETLRQSFEIEQVKNAETARHNQADEMLKAQKQGQDYEAKMASVEAQVMSIMESADGNEKQAVVQLLGLIQKRQAERTVNVQGG